MSASRKILSVFAVGGVGIAASALLVLLYSGRLLAADAGPAALPAVPSDVVRWGLLSAALSVAASSLAAGYAVARVASAGVGAVIEKPELIGRVLILVGLAEGIAIYGLIIAILILNQVS